MELSTFKYNIDSAFQLYALSSEAVKTMCKEFAFYNLRFYKEEATKKFTLSVDYPKANVYWFLEFKKYIDENILSKDSTYKESWEVFLKELKAHVKKEYTTLKSRLENIKIEDVVKAMVTYSLRDYQAFDLLNLCEKLEYSNPHVGLILSEQRTGKSRVAIAAADKCLYPNSTLIIVCPKSALQGWLDEVKEIDRVLGEKTYVGGIIKKVADIKDFNEKFDDTRINYRIITYDLLKRLTKTQLKSLVNIKNAESVMIVGDECHRLRNFKTDQSSAMFDLKDICKKSKTYIIGVTGTPAVKDTCDIFGILSFINYSKIQFKPTDYAFALFKEYFYICEDTSYGKQAKGLKRKAELLYIIKSCAVQTKQKSLDLFKNYKKEYKQILLDMDSKQYEIYKDIDEKFEYGTDIDCQNPAIKYLRLQQICNDPAVLTDDYKNVPPKFKYILGFCKKNDKQFIIMSKKLKALRNLALLFEKYGITYSALNGSMTLEIRNKEIRDFREGISKVFIIQSDIGREALTLPEASYIIFLDRDFAQGYNEQAEARMTPINGVPCTKYVIDLVMRDTVEEAIYNTLVIKKENIQNVNEIFRKGEIK